MAHKIRLTQGVEDVQAIEAAFNLPDGFVNSLMNESDWSLIIKSNALIESASTRMLTLYFGKAELEEVFSVMGMGNLRSGKMAFISALNLLSRKNREFIGCLASLRNKLAHDISNVNFSLVEYFQLLPEDKLQRYLKHLNLRLESMEVAGDVIAGDDLILKFPAIVIWTSLLDCLTEIYMQSASGVLWNQRIQKLREAVRKDNMENQEPIDTLQSEVISLSLRSDSFKC